MQISLTCELYWVYLRLHLCDICHKLHLSHGKLCKYKNYIGLILDCIWAIFVTSRTWSIGSCQSLGKYIELVSDRTRVITEFHYYTGFTHHCKCIEIFSHIIKQKCKLVPHFPKKSVTLSPITLSPRI